MEYEIIVADDLLELKSRVQKLSRFGWEPKVVFFWIHELTYIVNQQCGM